MHHRHCRVFTWWGWQPPQLCSASPCLICFLQQLSSKVALMWRIGGLLFWYMFVQIESEGKLKMNYWQYDLFHFLHTGTLLTSYARETAQCTTCVWDTTRCATSITVEFLHDGLVTMVITLTSLSFTSFSSSNGYQSMLRSLRLSKNSGIAPDECSHHTTSWFDTEQ